MAAPKLTNAKTPPLSSNAPGAPNNPANPPTPKWPTGAVPMLSTQEPIARPRSSSATFFLHQSLIQRVYSHGTGIDDARTARKKNRLVDSENAISARPKARQSRT